MLLPSERVLAERFSVARMTVRSCLEDLEVGVDATAFRFETRSLDAMGKVVEFGHSLHRADRYEIVMHVSRPAG